MAEDYNQQVAGSSWWDSSRTNRFYGAGSSSSSPSSSSTLTAATGSYGSWLTESTVDIDMRSSCSSDCCSSSSSSAVIFPADNSHRHLQAAACSMLDPSTLQIMGLALSSASSINDHWNHYSFLGSSNKAVEESSFLSMLKEGIGRTSTNFTTDQEAAAAGAGGGGGGLFGSQKIIHCEEESFNELGSSSSVMYSSPSSNIILQGLAISNHQQQQHHQHHQHQHQQQQQQRVYNPNPGYINYQQHDHEEDDHLQYGLGASGDIIDSNLLPASWSTKVPLRSPNQLAASTSMTEYMPPSHGQLQFNNSNAQFWNSSTGAIVGSIMSSSSSDVGRPSFYPSIVQSHLAMPVPLKQNNNSMESRGTLMKKSSSAVSGDQAAAAATKKYKRTRNHEASTTLPPYKLQVRKEKMGDRITALQQLVSPFGKTDTASVLTEAIEYIKFLHEQVNVLSTPYLKSGASIMQHHQNNNDKLKDKDGPRQDLKSQGLCLVPVSSTFPLAHETTVDFWTPAFGGTFR